MPAEQEKPRGRTWVTRQGVHVDRIASAWLIRRFIDPEARFKFVPAKGYVPEPGELRFDMFEAEFTHEGDRCTFEVLLERAGLTTGAQRHRRDRPRHRPEGRQVRARGGGGHQDADRRHLRGDAATTTSASRAAAPCSTTSTNTSARSAIEETADGPERHAAADTSRIRTTRAAHGVSRSARRSGSGRGSPRSASAARPGQIAVMHRILVEEKRWIGETRFLHALNYCMLLPGPEAQQLAVYIGWLMHRTVGGLVAGMLFVLPGFVAIMALSWIYAAFGNVGIVQAPVLRAQGGGAGHRARGGGAHRPARAEEPRHGRHRRRGVRRDLLLRRAVPAHHPGGGPDRLRRRTRRAPGVHGRWRPRHGRRQDAGRRRQRCSARSMPAHARPTLGWSLKIGGVCLVLWLGPVLALLLTLGPGNVFSRHRGVLLQDGGGHLRRRLCRAGLRRAAGGRDLSAGCSPARCWTASAWPRPRPAR